MRNKHRLRAATLAAALVAPIALAGCLGEQENETEAEAGSVDATALEGATIAVGSKDFNEQLMLGQLALFMFRAAGAEVEDKTDYEGTNATRQALLTGDADFYWEYTGTGWINHLGHEKPIPDAQEQYEAVKQEDLEKNGVVWGEPAPMNNTYALAVTDEFSEEHGIETSSDMADFVAENPDEASVCLESEFIGRLDGWEGFKQTYGMEIPDSNILELGTGVVYTQLDEGKCNFGEVFTTDGRIELLGLKPLEDDKGFFPLYNVAPTLMEDTAEEYPEILEVIAPLTEILDTETVTALNSQVDQGEDPADVAEEFLREEGFIK
jgi:osmoprotectant transport system substrate-binding protein